MAIIIAYFFKSDIKKKFLSLSRNSSPTTSILSLSPRPSPSGMRGEEGGKRGEGEEGKRGRREGEILCSKLFWKGGILAECEKAVKRMQTYDKPGRGGHVCK